MVGLWPAVACGLRPLPCVCVTTVLLVLYTAPHTPARGAPHPLTPTSLCTVKRMHRHMRIHAYVLNTRMQVQVHMHTPNSHRPHPPPLRGL